jgi:polysaccharide pyruvyl transferase WcaK-like protein
MLQDVYPRLGYIALREPLSLDQCRKLRDVNPAQSADCAFLTPLPAPAVKSPLSDAILITDSSVPWGRAALRKLQCALETLRKTTGRPVVYLSIFTNEQDRPKAADPLGVPYYAFNDTTEYLAHLQRSKFVLAGRYHTAVFSALCGVPFMPLQANTPKNSGLLALLDYPVPCLNPVTESAGDIERAALAQLAAAPALVNHLASQREKLLGLARRNVNDASR